MFFQGDLPSGEITSLSSGGTTGRIEDAIEIALGERHEEGIFADAIPVRKALPVVIGFEQYRVRDRLMFDPPGDIVLAKVAQLGFVRRLFGQLRRRASGKETHS